MEEFKLIDQESDANINCDDLGYCQNYCRLYKCCQHNLEYCPIIEFENVIKSLPSTFQFVIRNSYGIDNAKIKTLQEIASELSYSEFQIQQIKEKAICQLIRSIGNRSLKTLSYYMISPLLLKEIFGEFNNYAVFLPDIFLDENSANILTFDIEKYFFEINTPVSELNLTSQCIKTLETYNIYTIFDILSLTHEKLLYQYFLDDPKTLIELYQRLYNFGYGYKLRDYEFIETYDDFITEITFHVYQDYCIEKSKTSIRELDISKRALNALLLVGCDTIEDVISFNLERLSHFRNMGDQTIQEVIEKMHDLGFAFADETEIYLPVKLLPKQNSNSENFSKKEIEKNKLTVFKGMTKSLYDQLLQSGIISDKILFCKTKVNIASSLNDNDTINALESILLKNDLSWLDHYIAICENCGKKMMTHISQPVAYCEECTQKINEVVSKEKYRVIVNTDNNTIDIINLSDELMTVHLNDFYIRYNYQDYDRKDCCLASNIVIFPKTERTIVELDRNLNDFHQNGAYILIQINDKYYMFISNGTRWVYEKCYFI